MHAANLYCAYFRRWQPVILTTTEVDFYFERFNLLTEKVQRDISLR